MMTKKEKLRDKLIATIKKAIADERDRWAIGIKNEYYSLEDYGLELIDKIKEVK